MSKEELEGMIADLEVHITALYQLIDNLEGLGTEKADELYRTKLELLEAETKCNNYKNQLNNIYSYPNGNQPH